MDPKSPSGPIFRFCCVALAKPLEVDFETQHHQYWLRKSFPNLFKMLQKSMPKWLKNLCHFDNSLEPKLPQHAPKLPNLLDLGLQLDGFLKPLEAKLFDFGLGSWVGWLVDCLFGSLLGWLACSVFGWVLKC